MAISLKKGQSVSLVKKSQTFSNIDINLNWDAKKTKGFFKLFEKSIDLDIGCLYELKDGSKDCVQALGNSFGDLFGPPYVKLSGDDRSGNNTEGETLLISGEHWDKFNRVLVYSFIYEGVPRWSDANGVVHIKTDGESYELSLDESQNNKIMCAIALLENINGTIKLTKLNQYFSGHEEMDRAFGWGMNWVSGSK